MNIWVSTLVGIASIEKIGLTLDLSVSQTFKITFKNY